MKAYFFLIALLLTARSFVAADECSNFTAGSTNGYSVTYTTTGDEASTSFVFNICNTLLGASKATLFQLRLSDSLLADSPSYSSTPAGTTSSCLLSVPLDGTCETVTLRVRHDGGINNPYSLLNICQEGLGQSEGSCIYNLELADGLTGFNSFPAPLGPPPAPGPTPTPGPGPAPTPTPSPYASPSSYQGRVLSEIHSHSPSSKPSRPRLFSFGNY
jgi:hypothetical protein